MGCLLHCRSIKELSRYSKTEIIKARSITITIKISLKILGEGVKLDTFKINKRKTKMIAHRGLSSFERENTMLAFIAAGNRSYYGIECDLHKTKDGIFVIIHDDTTKRLSPIDKIIANCTYEELLKINLYDIVDNKPKPYLIIPTLVNYLDTCLKYRKHAFIEFKGLFQPEDLEKVINIASSRNYINKTTFISFTIENLLHVKAIDNNIKCQFLTTKFDDNLLQVLLKYQIDLDILYEAVTKQTVKEIHNHNLQINTWTVNDPIIAEKLAHWGVDFITTDILE